MRLDHVSYVASHDQISDVVNRIGSQIGTAFIDGGIHPKFGTRNFTAPLLNGQYIEVVCPLDHPATDATPFGKAVAKKAGDGGGWMTWVFSTDNISNIEEHFGRKAVDGQRKKPNGYELKWKQIGVQSVIDNPELPFFIEWLTTNHPSVDGIATAAISNIEINGKFKSLSELLVGDIRETLGDIKLKWEERSDSESIGITLIDFKLKDKTVSIY